MEQGFDNKPEMKSKEADFKYMVRIVNTDLDGKKQILYALRKIKGIGINYANFVCGVANVNKQTKAGYLSTEQVKRIEEVIKNPLKYNAPEWMLNRRSDPETGIDSHLLSADLIFMNEKDIKEMKKTKSYKGLRHAWGLTVRGQRTKSNFRKNKGKGSLGVKKKSVGQPAAPAKPAASKPGKK